MMDYGTFLNSGFFNPPIHYQDELNARTESDTENPQISSSTVNRQQFGINRFSHLSGANTNAEAAAIVDLKRYLRRGNFQEVIKILQGLRCSDLNRADFLHLWDEAQYIKHKTNTSHYGPFTSVQRFRIRQRNPPPEGICPGGQRPPGRLPSQAVKVLKDWYRLHTLRPFPCRLTKEALAKRAGISVDKVACWFANARRKHRESGVESVVGKTRTVSTQTTVYGTTAATESQRVPKVIPLSSFPETPSGTYCETAVQSATTDNETASNRRLQTQRKSTSSSTDVTESNEVGFDGQGVLIIADDDNMEEVPFQPGPQYILCDSTDMIGEHVVSVMSLPSEAGIASIDSHKEDGTEGNDTKNTNGSCRGSKRRPEIYNLTPVYQPETTPHTVLAEPAASPLCTLPETHNLSWYYAFPVDLSTRIDKSAMKAVENLGKLQDEDCKRDVNLSKQMLVGKENQRQQYDRVSETPSDVACYSSCVYKGRENDGYRTDTRCGSRSVTGENRSDCSNGGACRTVFNIFHNTVESSRPKRPARKGKKATWGIPRRTTGGNDETNVKPEESVSRWKLRVKLKQRQKGEPMSDTNQTGETNSARENDKYFQKTVQNSEADFDNTEYNGREYIESLKTLCEKVSESIVSPVDYALSVEIETPNKNDVDMLVWTDANAGTENDGANCSYTFCGCRSEHEYHIARENEQTFERGGMMTESDIIEQPTDLRVGGPENYPRACWSSDWQHTEVSHSPDTTSVTASPFMNPAQYSMAEIYHSPIQEFGTVVGEAIQGLLYLSSSQESGTSYTCLE